MSIPIFQSRDVRNPIQVYGGLDGTTLLLTLNERQTGVDTGDYIFEVNEVGIKQGFKSTVETRDNEDGLEMYGVYKTHKLITISGVARFFDPAANTTDMADIVQNNMHYRANQLVATFDPALRTFQSQYGLRAEVQLVWKDFVTIADHGDNLLEKMIWVRPQGTPDMVISEYFGNAFPFKIDLLAGDPRTYRNDLRNSTWVSPFATKQVGNAGDYPTQFEEIRLAITGNGSSNFLLQSTNAEYANPDSFYNIDFSTIGAGSHGISLFPRDRQLVVDGFIRNDLFKSPPVWGVLPPALGTNTFFTVSGTTGLTLITFFYRDAFSL